MTFDTETHTTRARSCPGMPSRDHGPGAGPDPGLSAASLGPHSLLNDGVTRAQPIRVVQYAKARLEVTQGPERGKRLVFNGTPVRVGSSSECTLVLTADTASRHHCQVTATAD